MRRIAHVKVTELLVEQMGRTRRWTLALLDDFEGDDWTFQSKPGLAHALWLCGHLASAQHRLIHERCLQSGVLDDAYQSHFQIGIPVPSSSEHDYPPIELVFSTMAEVQRKTCEAVLGMSDALLAEPAFGAGGKPHPHYDNKLGAVSHVIVHEAFHAGQIATIRRLLGRTFLR